MHLLSSSLSFVAVWAELRGYYNLPFSMSRANFGEVSFPFAIWPPQALSQLLPRRGAMHRTLQTSSRARPHGLRLAAEREPKKIFDYGR